MATLRDALVSGSYLVICHSCRDAKPDLADPATTVYTTRVAAQLCLRSRDQIAGPQQYWGLVGVGRRLARAGPA
jgi:hypothetical protein